jgi:hypothetical protein
MHCHSCTAPMTDDFKGASEIHCKYCSDEEGNLKPRDQVKMGIMMWLKGWQGNVSEEQLSSRADHFMNAMPAWAED